ncbi:chromatin assembly factor 1 subunit A [Manduca sexta]|uniref:Chromatin assembly factor 1 subunit A dimerization domain-containing protein n=1 Tax=Manduca sexta TaxID=7130 RepID=A0A922CC98_MANSE|nr:chromatin assembly factor 1 subunit A [Manduca sexta]KAG6441605.1 hypothetical protein O3G_MSEX001907 [Manduca sexta]
MKTNKASEETEVTPSKKKLKQARLPFKTISEGSPTSAPLQTRKRKLSASEPETTPKLGKICKENDPVEDLVVISDDDSKDGQKSQKQDISMNPYVKLVDTAWKKKIQKGKTTKRKRSIRNKSLTNGSVETESGNDTSEEKGLDDSETMDVDEPNQEIVDIKNTNNDKRTDSKAITSDNKANSTNMGVIIDEENMSSQSVIAAQNEINDEGKLNGDMNMKESHGSEEKGNTKHPTNAKKDKQSPHKLTNEELVDKEVNLTESDGSNKSSSESEMDTNLSEEKNCGSPKDSNSKTDKNSPKEKVTVTPKRSARNRAKKELDNSIASPTNTKLNESVSSNPTTPKQSRSSSVTSAPGNESLNDSSTVSKNLTPKQLQKKLESAKKREEREKEKQEREKKRQQEKEERAKQKQEKEEQKRKEREEKEEQKRKEKEEKEKQKEMEKKIREEKEEQKRKEKEEKEEQRRKEKEARDEEKRKKQEAIELEKQEQELKKKKAAEAFVNFFVPKQKSDKDQTTVGPVSKNSMLSSFTIKTDMRLAPTKRVDLDEEQRNKLDTYLQDHKGSNINLYLKCLKNGTSKPLSSGKTWPISDKDEDDVMIVEDELPPMDAAGEILTCEPAPREKLRPKLLSFHENRRPPYWGTWRKKSASIKPRKPFGQDQKQLDYEVDSDEEWEEEQEGESIDGSAAGSDDEQEADEYEVDNEVFVPHGYLSDEEATMDDDDVLSLSPETQKARLKHLEDEFESEMKKPTEKLKPRMYGLLWETNEGGKPEKCVDSLWNYFGKLSMIMNDPSPLLQPSNEPEETEKKKVKKKKVVPSEKSDQKSPKLEKKKKVKADKEAKPANKTDAKKNVSDKKNQPGINVFLAKLKST